MRSSTTSWDSASPNWGNWTPRFGLGGAFWNSTPATISAASDVSYLRPEAERDARFSILYPPSIRQLTSFGISNLACRIATFRLLFI
jgi:hypothetical protein